MSASVEVSEDGRTLTVRVPLAHRKRGGRKLVVAPDGGAWASARPRIDNALVKALARAHRWRRMLESGVYATVEEIAQAQRINASYFGRTLRLTLLAPDIVEAILGGRQAPGVSLGRLVKPFPADWLGQHISLAAHARAAPALTSLADNN